MLTPCLAWALMLALPVLQQEDPQLEQEIENAQRKDTQPGPDHPAPKPPAEPTPALALPPSAPSPAEAQPTTPALPAQNAQSVARAPGMGLLNPAMSVILDADFGYYGVHHSSFVRAGVPLAGDDPGDSAFSIQEVELAFTSAIDPYLEGAVFLTIPNLERLEVEEGYLTTTSLPANLQLRAGIFRSQIGRNNTQHLHLQSFTRRPLMTALLFGADGLRAPGLQVSVLLPLPWFVTVYAEVLSVSTPEDPALFAPFGGGQRGDLANLTETAVIEQFFELGEQTALALGLNFATGKAYLPTIGPQRAYLYGADFTLKWKPPNVVQHYRSLSWTTEVFARTLGDGGPTEGALYTEPVFQVARRWYLGARFDATGLPDGPNMPRRYGLSGSLTFTPSEFSRIRGYYQEIFNPDEDAPNTEVVFLQAEFSLGSHGAHPY